MKYSITMERTQRVAFSFTADNDDEALHKRLSIQYGFNFPVISGPPRRKIGAMSEVGEILWVTGAASLPCCL